MLCKKLDITKEVERLVNPIDVGSMHFIQSFNQLLPKFIQERLVKSSAQKYPYMGFVVEPYSFFLFYEIIDVKQARSLLSVGFRLIKSQVTKEDEPKYYACFGCFTAHTSAFWGARIEFYIIAEDEKTGLLTWVIVDYDSNTISHDKKHGLRSPSCSQAVISTNYTGKLFVDFKRDDNTRKLVFESNIRKGTMTKLNQRLWLEGNLSICYGRTLSDGNAEVFSLKFNPGEVEKALEIPLDYLNMQSNSWYSGLFRDKPSRLVCFPYAQHFVSDSPGHSSNLKNKEELINAITAIDFDKIEVFSTKQFKTMMILSMVVSFVVTTILILLLVFR